MHPLIAKYGPVPKEFQMPSKRIHAPSVNWGEHTDVLTGLVESLDNAEIAQIISGRVGFRVSKYSVANALAARGIRRSPEALQRVLNGNRNRKDRRK